MNTTELSTNYYSEPITRLVNALSSQCQDQGHTCNSYYSYLNRLLMEDWLNRDQVIRDGDNEREYIKQVYNPVVNTLCELQKQYSNNQDSLLAKDFIKYDSSSFKAYFEFMDPLNEEEFFDNLPQLDYITNLAQLPISEIENTTQIPLFNSLYSLISEHFYYIAVERVNQLLDIDINTLTPQKIINGDVSFSLFKFSSKRDKIKDCLITLQTHDFISKTVKVKDFETIFNNSQPSQPIIWIKGKEALAYFIKTLMNDKRLIKKIYRKWQVTATLFIDENGNHFDAKAFNSQHPPVEETKKIIHNACKNLE